MIGSSLEVLRAEARDERGTVILERCRNGEDPWEFMDDLPTIDELVVYLLRADAIRADDARMRGAAREYRLLRQIALRYPELTPTVWRILGERAGAISQREGDWPSESQRR